MKLTRRLNYPTLWYGSCLSQKAILESDTLWAQNKKLIDTKEKGLRRSVSGSRKVHKEW